MRARTVAPHPSDAFAEAVAKSPLVKYKKPGSAEQRCCGAFVPMFPSDAISDVPVERLTPDQIACLKGVLAHRTSKQIARDLGISPHTVDARIRAAIKQLGVETRREAALTLENFDSRSPHKSFVYQSLTLQDSARTCDLPVTPMQPSSAVIYPVSDETEHEQNGFIVNDGPASAWPDAGFEKGVKTLWKPQRNLMGPSQRVLAIVAISLGSAALVALIILALHALASLTS